MKGKAPPDQSTFFHDVGSDKSHIRVTVALDDVSPQCTFGAFAVNTEQKALPLAMFEFFQFSVSENEIFSLRATSLQGHTIFLGPETRHVKEASFFFRPSENLCGQSVFLRISCFENKRVKGYGDSAKIHIARPILWNPQHQRIVQLKGSVWHKTEMEGIAPHECKDDITELPMLNPYEPIDTNDYAEEIKELGELEDLSSKEQVEELETEIFEYQGRIFELEEELQKSKDKFFTTDNKDYNKRCDKCYDVIESCSHFRSVFWVHREQFFEKYYCFECEKKPKELRRRLTDWYWKDGGAHRPIDYFERAVFTAVNAKRLCRHWTLEETSDEFSKSF